MKHTFLFLLTLASPLAASTSLKAQDVTGYLTAGRRIADPDVALPSWSPLADGDMATDTARFDWAMSGSKDNLDRQGARIAAGARTHRLRLGLSFESATVKGAQEVTDFTETGNTIPIRDSRVSANVSSTFGHAWGSIMGRYTQTVLADLPRSGGEVVASMGWRQDLSEHAISAAIETPIVSASDTVDDRPPRYVRAGLRLPIVHLPVALLVGTTWLADGPDGPSRSGTAVGMDISFRHILNVRAGINQGPRDARDMVLDVTIHMGFLRVIARATTGRPDVTATGIALASDR